MPYRIAIERDIAVKMRDGTSLLCDIYRPEHPKKRFPVLLSRTPYNKGPTKASKYPIMYSPFYYLNPIRAASNGYVVILQDVRGRWLSEGVFYPFLNEASDGYDTIEWASKLPYSNGKVAMFGGSYLGATQWLAATSCHVALVGISVIQSGSQYHDGWTYDGGVLRLLLSLGWALDLSAETITRSRKYRTSENQLKNAFGRYSKWKFSRPLTSDRSLKRLAPYYYDWLKHSNQDEYWERWNIENHYGSINCSTLNIGGWYDPFLKGTIKNFVGMKRTHAKTKHYLVIGPWAHFPPYLVRVGDADFTSKAYVDLDDLQLNFLASCFGEKQRKLTSPVRIFVMGRNEWRNEAAWPPSGAKYIRFFLHEKGVLDNRMPGEEEPDRFVFDPRDPLPSVGGPNPYGGIQGPADQTSLYIRKDLLRYMTDPLERDVEVTGPVAIDLWISTSAVDTDFTSRFVDVFEDGHTRDLTSGILRASHRISLKKREMLERSVPYLLRIDMGATSNLFRKGHRIGVQISSSDFPAYDVNPNNGKGSNSAYGEMRTASQCVYHDRSCRSNLVLPIISKGVRSSKR